ncbi:hypothetical protein [Micromonospora cathayae]|uniref:Uncharacterized protein n=1 Tax=Micromonospora cathayae TaxID=3028804 RepID=A0ABY7ZXI3_9ACTN|nr:hypothetical protein [Micromonospora sp. HUAS 3]WDZ87785.1 hypothetical protein PVK37_15945 [Micromonospora sp. HUAS 3]
MNPHRQHQMDRETVERLLDGSTDGSTGASERLVRLLGAVRAAPLPHELAGEPAAVRAFRTARRDPAGHRRDRPARRGLLARLTVRTAVAAVALTATGGVALAAVQGVLPGPLRPPVPVPTDGPTATSTHGPTGPGDRDPQGTPPTGGVDGWTPAPALTELCRTYRTAGPDERDRVLRSPAGRRLVAGAGGRERVDGYCAAVEREASAPPAVPGGTPTTDHGDPTGTPGPRPSGRPDHPPHPSVAPPTPTVAPPVPDAPPPPVPDAPPPPVPDVQLPPVPDVQLPPVPTEHPGGPTDPPPTDPAARAAAEVRAGPTRRS